MQVVDGDGNVYGEDNLEINDASGKPKTTGGGGAVWGGITGTLSAQTDLQTALNAKQNTLTPAALTKVDDTNVTLTLGGSPSTSLLQATSLTLGWTGTLADSRIASATTWNAKQNALVSGTNIKTVNSTSLLGSGDVAVGLNYERRSDFVNPYQYSGTAVVGTAESSATWTIKRINFTTPGSPITQTAVGSWTNRLSLIYT
jgi:hypothetical protein